MPSMWLLTNGHDDNREYDLFVNRGKEFHAVFHAIQNEVKL